MTIDSQGQHATTNPHCRASDSPEIFELVCKITENKLNDLPRPNVQNGLTKFVFEFGHHRTNG